MITEDKWYHGIGHICGPLGILSFPWAIIENAPWIVFLTILGGAGLHIGIHLITKFGLGGREAAEPKWRPGPIEDDEEKFGEGDFDYS